MEPIHAKFILTESDLVKNIRRTLYSSFGLKIVAILFLFAFIIGVFIIFEKGISYAIPSLVLPVIVFFGLLILPGYAGRKGFKSNPESSRKINWLISDNGIEISNGSEKETWNWTDIKKVKFYNDAICIKAKATNKSAFMFKKGFIDSTSYNNAIELINKKCNIS